MVTDRSGDGTRPDTGRVPSGSELPNGSPAESGDMPLLRLRGVSKSFGPVQALTDINLDIPNGEVTALVGDNGAGKSTLIKTIAGIWQPSSGELIWNGKPVHVHSPKDATDLGIAAVYQDLALCDNLDIASNLMLGRERRRQLLSDIRLHSDASAVLSDLRIPLTDTTRNLRTLVKVLEAQPSS